MGNWARLAWASTESQEEGEGGGKLEPAHPNKLFVPPSAVWLWAGLNHGMGTISIPMELLKKTSELRVMI